MGDARDEVIEYRARAIYEADPESGYRNGDDFVEWRALRYGPHVWDYWLSIAEATMQSDDDAGYALVPKEATGDMCHAAFVRLDTPTVHGDPKARAWDALQAYRAIVAKGNVLPKGE